MGCAVHPNCGGCDFRDLELNTYQKQKEQNIRKLLEENLGDLEGKWCAPKFLPDGLRRRASFAFEFRNQKVVLGFNENKSKYITDLSSCFMLSKKLNGTLPVLRDFLTELCAVQVLKKQKGKKFLTFQILSGDLLVLEAQNGIDIVLETDADLLLEHRQLIFDFMNQYDDFIRFSWRKKHAQTAEPIIEKAKPFIRICQTDVFVAPGDFLQPSKEGEKTLVDLVLKYVGQTRGKMADLFCGIGTFSYALCALDKTEVLAVDVSKSLLEGFEKSIHKQMISNVKILQKNLFLYPLTGEELKGTNVIVFDPPRAGAKEQVKEFCLIDEKNRPQKIIAVSCNPLTFARDAKMLINGGYKIESLTMVDQFVYSEHSEIVCLFTNGK